MYKVLADTPNAAHSCVFNLRNLDHPFKVLVRYLQKVFHVYVDNGDGLGYKNCLALKFEEGFKDHHIAFTAMTGQGAHIIITC